MAFFSDRKAIEHPKSLQALWRDCLEKSDTGLLAQSVPRTQKDGVVEPFSIEDLEGLLRRYGNTDGWGMAVFSAQEGLTRIRQAEAANGKDSGFKAALKRLANLLPKTFLAHIRAASPACHNKTDANNHPFTYGPWAFMHNGFVPGAKSQAIQAKIKTMFPDGTGPKGTTDSEASFYYWMGTLQKQYGTVDTETVGFALVRRSFAETLQALLTASEPEYIKVNPAIMGLSGQMQTDPSLNFIASDGQHLLAFRKGEKLYLGKTLSPDGGITYLLSSEPVKPSPQQPAIQWLDIPEESIISLTRQKNGTVKAEIHALKYLLQ